MQQLLLVVLEWCVPTNRNVWPTHLIQNFRYRMMISVAATTIDFWNVRHKSSYIIDHMEQCHRNVDFSHPCNHEPVNWIPSFCHTYQTHHYYMPFFTKQVRRYIPIGHTWRRNNNNYHTLCSRSPFANSSANFILIEHSATIDHLLLWCYRMNKYACAMHFSCTSIHTATLRSHEIDCETGQN